MDHLARTPPFIVLDTNVVLDCMVFRDPACTALWRAVTNGTVQWIATAAMRDELAHVLSRRHLDGWARALPDLWADWARLCVLAPQAAPGDGNPSLRCSDPDDQKFIDLAVAAPAPWLLSRDAAVLKLAGRLRLFGVSVLPPRHWPGAIEAGSQGLTTGRKT